MYERRDRLLACRCLLMHIELCLLSSVMKYLNATGNLFCSFKIQNDFIRRPIENAPPLLGRESSSAPAQMDIKDDNVKNYRVQY